MTMMELAKKLYVEMTLARAIAKLQSDCEDEEYYNGYAQGMCHVLVGMGFKLSELAK
jgi:hypothetical protein